MSDEHLSTDPLQPHAHDPNPEPPDDDPTFTLHLPGREPRRITLTQLEYLPQIDVPDCTIISTGHGASGPFTFGGVPLLELIKQFGNDSWTNVEVLSADGFGNRIFRHELEASDAVGPIILAMRINGEPLTRRAGLVRLIVPGERDDALRQVKWVSRINLKGPAPGA